MGSDAGWYWYHTMVLRFDIDSFIIILLFIFSEVPTSVCTSSSILFERLVG